MSYTITAPISLEFTTSGDYVDYQSSITAPNGPGNAGTSNIIYNFGTGAVGDILYATTSNALTSLPIGTAGQVLTVNAGVPSWQTASTEVGQVGFLAVKSGNQTTSGTATTSGSIINTWVTGSGAQYYTTVSGALNTSSGIFTTPSGGYYIVTAQVEFNNQSNAGTRVLDLVLNSSGGVGTILRRMEVQPTSTASAPQTLSFTVNVQLAVNDRLTLELWRKGGLANMNLTVNANDGTNIPVTYWGLVLSAFA